MGGTRLLGLYAITDDQLSPPDKLLDHVTGALNGGAAMVQYRNKHPRGSVSQARSLLAICRRRNVPLIINDDIALAREIGAEGVHLGRDDATIAEARAILGPQAIIGASCYNRLELAIAAEQAGADYVAFGRFFNSLTKPTAIVAETGLLGRARAQLKVPIVAIGGITAQNAPLLISAGADMVAVVHGVFGAPDPAEAAREFAGLFT